MLSDAVKATVQMLTCSPCHNSCLRLSVLHNQDSVVMARAAGKER